MRIQGHRATSLALLACVAISLCSAWSRACSPDFSGNGEVDVDDLLALINAWGPCPAPPAVCTADISPTGGNSVVDVDDLLALINAWGPCDGEDVTTTIIGIVQLSDETSVQDAVVVTDLGGQGISNSKGAFQFDVTIPADTTSLMVTAVATMNGVNYIGSTVVSRIAAGGTTDAGLILLNPESNNPPCERLEWLPTFGGEPGTNLPVNAMAVFDDGSGSGPALCVGGTFLSAQGVAASRVAKWDGNTWASLGTGVNSNVYALTVFDDGSGNGPALYAGGTFTIAGGVSANYIAKWDGSSWSTVGGGMNGVVYVLSVFDDGSGSGPALYAAGNFTGAGGVPTNRIAKWNGTSWSPLGVGIGGPVYALTGFDGALYAGGAFNSAGGAAANNIAQWDGTTWSTLGTGVIGTVRALAAWNDGTGPALYAGGAFVHAGGVGVPFIAKWSGTSWSALGGGLSDVVYALGVFDDGSGSGPVLCAGGSFAFAGGTPANRIAKWNGASWSPLGSGMNDTVLALNVFNDKSGRSALCAGGDFTIAGESGANHVAHWNGTSWSALSGAGVSKFVIGSTVFDDNSGSGPCLYAAGAFDSTGGVPMQHIAKWDGTSWMPLASGMNGWAYAFASFDDGSGSGSALYAAGSFTTAGGVPANRIAKWNGTSWSPLGLGLDNYVEAVAVCDDGSSRQPALYAGGVFTKAGGIPASRIAKWNGISWSPLGSGMNAPVYAMTAFDDGSGEGSAIYAGGQFTTAGGVSAIRIAKWDGSSWSALGSGITGGPSPIIQALVAFDDGSGPALYAAGNFSSAGGVSANNIAKWNGASWSPLGSGIGNTVFALAVFDDGSGDGPALYAAAGLSGGASPGSSQIAKWNGKSWSFLDGNMNNPVNTLTVFDDRSGGGPALFAGGYFGVSPAGDSYIAKWGCPPK